MLKPAKTAFDTTLQKLFSEASPSAADAQMQALSAQVNTYIEQEVDARLEQRVADVEQRIQAEVQAKIEARIQAEVDRRVATEVAQEVRRLMEEAQLARQQMFGRSSEAHPGQGELFNEAESVADGAADAEADSQEPDAAGNQTPPAQRKRRGKRRPLPAKLPRVDVVVDIEDAERQCECGTAKVKIGEEVSEQLDIIPMQVRVIRTVRPRYACPKGQTPPVVAPMPARVLPRSQFSAGFLAMLLVVKYVDGLPLNRFAQVLKRHAITVPRQSLARAVIATAQALQPLHNLCRDMLLDGNIIHMDETRVQVLKPPDSQPASPINQRHPKAKCGFNAAGRRTSLWLCSITTRRVPVRCPKPCSKTGVAI